MRTLPYILMSTPAYRTFLNRQMDQTHDSRILGRIFKEEIEQGFLKNLFPFGYYYY